MRDISNEVGVTQANLYHHFRDKAALVEMMLAHVFESRAQSLNALLADPPHVDPLGTFVHWFYSALTSDRVFARLLYLELWAGDEARIDALSRSILQTPFRTVVDAVAADATAASAKRVALSLIGFILGQVLVRPLAPGLVGQGVSSAALENATRRVLPLLQQAWTKV